MVFSMVFVILFDCSSGVEERIRNVNDLYWLLLKAEDSKRIKTETEREKLPRFL